MCNHVQSCGIMRTHVDSCGLMWNHVNCVERSWLRCWPGDGSDAFDC
jgi:hypothetical protein